MGAGKLNNALTVANGDRGPDRLRAGHAVRGAMVAAALGAMLAVSGCNTEQVLIHGAVVNQDQIDLVPVGSSREQVLLSLGTPSTTGSFGTEIFYYISQRKSRTFAWQQPKVVDQRVLAVYFDEEQLVSRVADYGLQDGKVFDFISRTTPTAGRDLTFLGHILFGGAPRPNLGL